jgi:hypothetical protein
VEAVAGAAPLKQLTRDALLMKLGAARQQWAAAWRLVALRVPKKDEEITNRLSLAAAKKLRQARRREVGTSCART